MNPYDISKVCDGPIAETLCYPITKYLPPPSSAHPPTDTHARHISNFLSLPATRALLGVDPAVPTDFRSCSPAVGAAFHAQLDSLHPTQHYVGALLERGVRALIYVGEFDWICNWVGNEAWTRQLEWTGGDAFRGESMGTWKFEGREAGRVRSSGGLTFATIKGAGHMVSLLKDL